jgi:hypothetical protein
MSKVDIEILLVVLVVIMFELIEINIKLKKCVGLLGECVNALDSIDGKTPDED